jgi:hypothetical protein
MNLLSFWNGAVVKLIGESVGRGDLTEQVAKTVALLISKTDPQPASGFGLLDAGPEQLIHSLPVVVRSAARLRAESTLSFQSLERNPAVLAGFLMRHISDYKPLLGEEEV